MASKTIVVPDPSAANSTGINFTFAVSIDGSANIALGPSGFAVNYAPAAGGNFATDVQDTAHPSDLTGPQLLAIRNAFAPVLAIAKARMGF